MGSLNPNHREGSIQLNPVALAGGEWTLKLEGKIPESAIFGRSASFQSSMLANPGLPLVLPPANRDPATQIPSYTAWPQDLPICEPPPSPRPSFQELACAVYHTGTPLTIAQCLSGEANPVTALLSSQSHGSWSQHCTAAQGRDRQPRPPCQASLWAPDTRCCRGSAGVPVALCPCCPA